MNLKRNRAIPPASDETRFRKSMGRVIAAVRKGLDMTQATFADALELDQTTVAKAETGVHLWRLETWLKLGKILNVPFYELFKSAADTDGRAVVEASKKRTIEALESTESELLRFYRSCNNEGREILMDKAHACAELYSRDRKVVVLTRQKARKGL